MADPTPKLTRKWAEFMDRAEAWLRMHGHEPVSAVVAEGATLERFEVEQGVLLKCGMATREGKILWLRLRFTQEDGVRAHLEAGWDALEEQATSAPGVVRYWNIDVWANRKDELA